MYEAVHDAASSASKFWYQVRGLLALAQQDDISPEIAPDTAVILVLARDPESVKDDVRRLRDRHPRHGDLRLVSRAAGTLSRWGWLTVPQEVSERLTKHLTGISLHPAPEGAPLISLFADGGPRGYHPAYAAFGRVAGALTRRNDGSPARLLRTAVGPRFAQPQWGHPDRNDDLSMGFLLRDTLLFDAGSARAGKAEIVAAGRLVYDRAGLTLPAPVPFHAPPGRRREPPHVAERSWMVMAIQEDAGDISGAPWGFMLTDVPILFFAIAARLAHSAMSDLRRWKPSEQPGGSVPS